MAFVAEPTTLRALSDLPEEPVSIAESTLVFIDFHTPIPAA